MHAEIEDQRINLHIESYQGNNARAWECGYFGQKYLGEKGSTTHTAKMRQETKMRDINCRIPPGTCSNISTLKTHMLKKGCSNKPQQTGSVDRADIVITNIPNIGGDINKRNDYDSGKSDRTAIFSDRIQVGNEDSGIRWKRINTPYGTLEKQIIRTHLAVVRRTAKAGKSRRPYCEEEHAHIGNPESHSDGFVGRKRQHIPPGKARPRIWGDNTS